jgi:hypothetical protein
MVCKVLRKLIYGTISRTRRIPPTCLKVPNAVSAASLNAKSFCALFEQSKLPSPQVPPLKDIYYIVVLGVPAHPFCSGDITMVNKGLLALWKIPLLTTNFITAVRSSRRRTVDTKTQLHCLQVALRS